ncbi:transglutaminase-like domain-containing protein [Marinilabilia rubra]|nr:transglutaminase-like domain-containing protein [Marinilabilia rubra]
MKFENGLKERLTCLFESGEFDKVEFLLDSINVSEHEYIVFADSLKDYMHRFRLEYPVSSSQLKKAIEQKGVKCSEGLIQQWEKRGMLEYKFMNGVKWYFRNAVYNLFLLNDSLRSLAGYTGLNEKGLGEFCVKHIQEVLMAYGDEVNGEPVLDASMMLKYSMTFMPGVVPSGTLISAWMPYGARDCERQTGVRLFRSHPAEPGISGINCPHQSLFLSQVSAKDSPVTFSSTIGITGHASYFSPSLLSPIRFGDVPDSIGRHLGERHPHIVFSKKIRHLADSLTHPDMTPYEVVKAFYYWIDSNIPWASAVEYGLISNIPEYTLEHMHGDCGMQTLLFMTLCRYKGIPARWQSGWMLHPGYVNLHDWCEVWYPTVGWVPVDVSFKLQKSRNIRIREFYISGIDAYRFIVNNDYGREFCPPKKWLRSEPWDFQRGEAEWERGNLYFNQWSREMEVEYLPEM